MQADVLICAAGQGKRMGLGHNKLFQELADEPVLIHTLKVWEEQDRIGKIILVVAADEIELVETMLQPYSFLKEIRVVVGGSERQESVFNGLLSYGNQEEPEFILIHDGARPFIKKEEITRVLDEAILYGSALVAVPVKDTIKRVSGKGFIEETLDRATLWAIQTPQAFRYRELIQAHRKAQKEGYLATDDAALMERVGNSVKIVQGSYDNIKLTTPEDLNVAEFILQRRRNEDEHTSRTRI